MEVKEYNNIEETEKLNSSNYIIELFISFQFSDYPSRIDNINELKNFTMSCMRIDFYKISTIKIYFRRGF